MCPEILSKEQTLLLQYIAKFNRTFYLVGGTAIALYLGHRRSVDFDLFTSKTLQKIQIKKKLLNVPFGLRKLFEDSDQLHYLINGVKVTFFSVPCCSRSKF